MSEPPVSTSPSSTPTSCSTSGTGGTISGIPPAATTCFTYPAGTMSHSTSRQWENDAGTS